jgi:hypothetical protein
MEKVNQLINIVGDLYTTNYFHTLLLAKHHFELFLIEKLRLREEEALLQSTHT